MNDFSAAKNKNKWMILKLVVIKVQSFFLNDMMVFLLKKWYDGYN
jgi:hypothetical protein